MTLTRSPRVLLVATDASRESLQRTLEASGFQVEATNDLTSAEHYLAWFPARLIIVDSRPDEESTFAGLKRLCKHHPSADVVVASNCGERRASERRRPGCAAMHVVTFSDVVRQAVALCTSPDTQTRAVRSEGTARRRADWR
jgi:DNA-binding NtrC family response regulator